MNRREIHRRVHLTTEGRTTSAPFVRCPEGPAWASLDTCRRCQKLATVDAASVTCACASEPEGPAGADETSVLEVMEATVLQVAADVSVDSVARALDDEDLPLAVVVDGDRRHIGVCSRHDLRGRPSSVRVRACMTPLLVTLLDVARVTDAIDLLVNRGLQNVPVLSNGRVAGIVTPRAVITWLARNLREERTLRASNGRKTEERASKPDWPGPCSGR